MAEPELAWRLYTRSFPLIDPVAMADADTMKHRRMAMLERRLKHATTRGPALNPLHR
ncbi:Rpn family recombination-promoting nuclease/putative transposase [Erwinia sp. 198]|uniref:Rpn family recombination-promoting nuclease/putative transposase n=1 Tax=Erwinia sp. 198 TaxID=2022746 RepID=UPI00131568A4|nr:Rpn family recombination-promoting nuclease/putative transposase [Erwinia sp. 198]